MKRCSNCKRETDGGQIVWVNYKINTHIKYLCKKCIEELKNDKKIISIDIKSE